MRVVYLVHGAQIDEFTNEPIREMAWMDQRSNIFLSGTDMKKVPYVMDPKDTVEELPKEVEDRIERFEEETGLTFDPSGPLPEECQYCEELFQYVPDHDCYGTRGENHEAALMAERECFGRE